jgi:predicted small lipoprotein YifL
MKKLSIVALVLSLSACGSVGGYSLNPMDYLGGSSAADAEASE